MSPGYAAPLIDAGWRTLFRIAFPVARVWWRLQRRHHEGALVALYVGDKLLLVRASYRKEWNFPGGSVRRGETPEAAAQREVAEEIGISAGALHAAGSIGGYWDGRQEQVHFFELRLDQLPDLRLDNREIIAARMMSSTELRSIALTGPVAAYVNRSAFPS